MPKLLTSLLIAVNLWGSVCACADDNTQMLASVRVGGCSGVTFAADDNVAYVATAHHCCGNVGDEITVGTVDGRNHRGRIIAYDANVDLAIVAIPRDAALALTPISLETPEKSGVWNSVSYPGSAGPIVQPVGMPKIIHHSDLGADRWLLALKSGTVEGGQSGGGNFRGTNLVAVTTHGKGTHHIWAASHNQLLAFVGSVPAAAKASGIDPDCPDGECKVCPKCGKIHRKDGWTPTPNKPVVLPEKVPRDGTFPDKQTSAYVVELVKRIDKQDKLIEELQQAVAKLMKPDAGETAPPPPLQPIPMKGDAGPRGLAGEPGPPGRDGKDGKPGVVTVVLKWADGKVIDSVADIPSGKRLTFPITKLISDAK